VYVRRFESLVYPVGRDLCLEKFCGLGFCFFTVHVEIAPRS